MKSYLGLIKKFLTKQYKRSILMIVAVALSVSIIAATGILIDSIKESNLNYVRSNYGNQGVTFRFVSNDKISSLKKNKEVSEVGLESAFVTPGYLDKSKECLKIISYDKVGAKLENLVVQKGYFPVKANEIAVEESFAKKNNLINKLGKSIDLNYSDNYVTTDSKTAPPADTKKHVILTGIIKDREMSKIWGSQAYVTLEGGKLLLGGDMNLSALVKLIDDSNIDETVENIKKEVTFPIYTMIQKNVGLINGLKLAKGMDIFYIIILFIILLASIASIYNIFSISVIERTRIFGLLRAIGADKNQIGRIILGEGFVISMIAIPLGLFIGTIMPLIVINILSKIKQAELVLQINPVGYIKVAVISFIAVLISSLSPMKLGKRITPIEAVSENGKLLGNEYKRGGFLSEFLNKFFGIKGRMVGINLTRNKKRFLATLFSIVISMMVFTVVSYSIMVLDPINSIKKSIGGDYVLETYSDNMKVGFSRKQLEEIKSLKGVKSAQGLLRYYGEAKLRKSLVIEEVKNFLDKNYEYSRNLLKTGICPISVQVFALDDTELKNLSKDLSEGEIDLEKMKKGPTALLMQSLSGKAITKLKLKDQLKTMIQYAEERGFNQVDVEFNIGGFLKNMSIKGNYSSEEMILVIHEKYLKQLFPESLYKKINVMLSKDAKEGAIKAALQAMSTSVNTSKVVSLKEEMKNTKDRLREVYMVLYSFVITIGIIGIISIINTITISILMRKKEFGVLRAIGMSLSQIRSMIYLEALFYGVIGTIIGSISGIGLSYAVYSFLHKRSLGVVWLVPVELISFAAVITVLSIVITSILPYKRVTSENIVDSIRTVD